MLKIISLWAVLMSTPSVYSLTMCIRTNNGEADAIPIETGLYESPHSGFIYAGANEHFDLTFCGNWSGFVFDSDPQRNGLAHAVRKKLESR